MTPQNCIDRVIDLIAQQRPEEALELWDSVAAEIWDQLSAHDHDRLGSLLEIAANSAAIRAALHAVPTARAS